MAEETGRQEVMRRWNEARSLKLDMEVKSRATGQGAPKACRVCYEA